MQRLKLFGGASIETEDGPVKGRAVQRRRLALLALLVSARARGTSRDRLIALLWPEADAENGRRFLSDSVYRINQALGDDVILAAGDELRVDPQRLPSDVGAFEEALARGDHEEAVRTYVGPFLDGFFLSDAPEYERWADGERDRLAREYARALEALAELAEQAGNGALAVSWWRRLAAHDPYNSRVALRLMQALAAAGERAAAIQHARVHETLLADELELQADPAVKALAEQLKLDVRIEPSPVPSIEAPPQPNVAQVASHDVSAPLRPEATPTGHRSVRHRVMIAALVGAAVIASIGVASWSRWTASSRSTTPDARTIAVLPFANLSADRANEYFSDGITDELIATLGQLRGLRVVSRTSAFAFKSTAIDIREVGRRLGAVAVVEGSVRQSGRTLRVTAQLVDASTGYDLWSDVYERELEDVFAIQQEIARAIAGKLVGTLRDSVKLAERSTRDAVTYDLYLRGRHAWHQRTRDGLEKAIEHFEQAIAREPEYARALVGLADAYAVSAFYDYLPPRDAYPKAEAAARRAIQADPALSAPHATLAYVQMYYHLDWRRAEEEYKRALSTDPDYSTAHQWYGNLLTVAGRFGDAEREFRAAQETDPLSVIAHAALGWSFYFAGKYDAAVDQSRRTLALSPDFELAHLWGGQALQELGRTADARQWLERAVEVSHGSMLTRLALGHLLGSSASDADRIAARALVREMDQRRARGEYLPAYEVAKVHLALGDRAAALRWFERAIDDRSHSRAFLRVDPQLAPLRDDARFTALLRHVEVIGARPQ